MKKLIALVLPVIALIVGIILYPHLPDEIPVHWNEKGEIDDYSSRAFAITFIPLFTLILTLILIFIPNIDPKRANWDKFMDTYLTFIVFFVFFMMFIHGTIILIALGYDIDLMSMLAIAMGLLILFIAKLLEKAEQNWFAGIRTPWTLSDEETWKSTHQFAAKLFYISGAITFFGVFDIPGRFLLLIVPILASSLAAVVYSYFDYRKRHKDDLDELEDSKVVLE